MNVESQVANPLKWNAEQPNLYKLVIELKKDGKVLERIERNIGFRTVETKDRQLYVNGARVKLAGVCHHEIDPLTGRADTMRHAEEDVKLFKSANLNDVRTSHYPPHAGVSGCGGPLWACMSSRKRRSAGLRRRQDLSDLESRSHPHFRDD